MMISMLTIAKLKNSSKNPEAKLKTKYSIAIFRADKNDGQGVLEPKVLEDSVSSISRKFCYTHIYNKSI